jgi:hypothetical protein
VCQNCGRKIKFSISEKSGELKKPPNGSKARSRRSIFWKLLKFSASPWLFVCLLAFAWVPVFVIGWLSGAYPHPGGNYDYWSGAALAWGLGITWPFTIAALAWLALRTLVFVIVELRKTPWKDY